jgi:hypothetical protein
MEVLQMKQRPRIDYTETDKALMWDPWQKGDSLHAIAQLFGKNSTIAMARTQPLQSPVRDVGNPKTG